MSVIDQFALDLPDLVAPPPDVLAGLSAQERAVVLDVLTRLIVKTIARQLSAADGQASDE